MQLSNRQEMSYECHYLTVKPDVYLKRLTPWLAKQITTSALPGHEIYRFIIRTCCARCCNKGQELGEGLMEEWWDCQLPEGFFKVLHARLDHRVSQPGC